MKRKFEFPKVDPPGIKSMKTWDKFKKWIVNNECHTTHDFKEMISSTFQIEQGKTMRRYKAEDGVYEYHERKENSENHLTTDEPQKTL